MTSTSAKRATGLVPREHLGGPIDGPRFVAFRLSLKDREDRLGRLARGRIRRVDLENERKASDRFLQAHVDRLRFAVLPDFFRRPTARLESGTQDGRSAAEDPGEVPIHLGPAMA